MKRPSPATAISLVALFFSLGGVGLAASKYIITSTHQIKPSVLKKLEGKGPAGTPGAPGAVGATGAAGVFSASNVTEVTGPAGDMCAAGGGTCVTGSSVATCPAGDVVISGGYSGFIADVTVAYDWAQNSGTAWQVVVDNQAAIPATVTAYAVCAS